MGRVETDGSMGLRPRVMTTCVRMFLRFTTIYTVVPVSSSVPISGVCVGSIRLYLCLYY